MKSEKYEEMYMELAEKYNKSLVNLAEEKKLNLELQMKMDKSFTNELIAINRSKEESLLEAISALIMYANEDLYNDVDEYGEYSTIDLDNGKLARAALKKIRTNA